MSAQVAATTEPQMCTVDDLIGGEPCPRVAQWEWQPDPDDHPVFLCNFHAEPFAPLDAVTRIAEETAS